MVLLESAELLMMYNPVPQLLSISSWLSQELKGYLDGQTQFTFVLDDPSGNSFIGPRADGLGEGQLVAEQYERSVRQAARLGLDIVGQMEPELETVEEGNEREEEQDEQ